MACEWFEDGRVARCAAVSGLLIPSHYEREKYCCSDDSHHCPTLRLFQLRGAPLPQDAYYALWLAPEPSDQLASEETELEEQPAASL
jgi:hypothetical protein